MTPTQPRLRRPRSDDRGSVTLFMSLTVVGLLVLIGLVVDGGTKVRAIQHADALAADAARTGGQAIAVHEAIAGNAPTLDTRAATRAATAYLTAHGVTGTAAITDGGRTLTVSVTSSAPTTFLGLIGITRITVQGHATATLVRGVTGATP